MGCWSCRTGTTPLGTGTCFPGVTRRCAAGRSRSTKPGTAQSEGARAGRCTAMAHGWQLRHTDGKGVDRPGCVTMQCGVTGAYRRAGSRRGRRAGSMCAVG